MKWFGFALGVLGLVGCAEIAGVFSKSPVSADEAAGVIDEGVSIGGCQAKGRAAKDAGQPDAYGVYDDCMKEGGLR